MLKNTIRSQSVEMRWRENGPAEGAGRSRLGAVTRGSNVRTAGPQSAWGNGAGVGHPDEFSGGSHDVSPLSTLGAGPGAQHLGRGGGAGPLPPAHGAASPVDRGDRGGPTVGFLAEAMGSGELNQPRHPTLSPRRVWEEDQQQHGSSPQRGGGGVARDGHHHRR